MQADYGMLRFPTKPTAARHHDIGARPVLARSQSGAKLESLEALRGIAALLVVFYHLQNIFGARAGVVPLGGLFGSGDRGVDVFFVLSGFIIARTHGKDIGKAERLPLYLYKRACRVYPSVWILTACAAAVYFCDFGGAAKAWKLDSWNVVASTLLLPQSKPPLVNVTWTLTYEIFFYLLFSSLVVSRRMGILLLLAWQAGTAVAAAHVIRFTGPLTAYYLRPVCLEFGIGMLCAILAAQPRVARGMSRPAMVFVAVAGIAAVILALLYEALWYPHGLEPVRPFVFGLGAGAAILGLTLLEQRKMLRVPAVLVRLGAASYAIYLVHFSVITLAATILVRTHVLPVSNFSMLTCAVFAIAAGAAFHRYVDQPLQVLLRSAGGGLFKHQTPALSGTNATPLANSNVVRARW